MNKKTIVIIIVILVIAAALFFYAKPQPQQQALSGNCTANPNFNSAQLSSISRTLAQINTYCNQAVNETACKDKAYYVIGEPLDVNKTRFHYIYSESPEVQPGREYKGKIIDICLWSSN